MASTDARPMPRKNTAYRVTFPLYDADGDLVTGATSPDSEVSIDGGTFADCTNEATEIATASGMYYLDLTAAEMNGDTIAVIVKSGTAKTLPLVFYPEEAGDVRVDVVQWLGTACATPTVAGVPEVDVTHWRGTAAAAEDTAGYPKVTIKDGTGTGELDTNAGKVALTDAGVDAIWDELLTTSAHNTDTSAGQRLRRASAIATDGVVNDAAATTTSFVVGGSVTVNDFYNDQVIVFTTGALAGQARPVLDYDGATKTITLDEALTSAPANGVEFVLIATHVHPVSQIQNGLATGAALATVQSDTNDIQTRLPAALVGGRMDSDVAVIQPNAVSASALAADAVDEILDEVVEGAVTLRQAIRLALSFIGAKVTGGGTTTITYRDIGDTKNRITQTVDSSGNRSASTLDGS